MEQGQKQNYQDNINDPHYLTWLQEKKLSNNFNSFSLYDTRDLCASEFSEVD